MYAKSYARRHVAAWGFVASLPCIAAAIAGFYDNRYWFLGLMLLFTVYPMIPAIVWGKIVGRRSIARLLRPQQWTFDTDGNIVIDFFPFEHDDNVLPADTMTLTRSRVMSVATEGKVYRFNLNERNMPFILIKSSLLTPQILSLYD